MQTDNVFFKIGVETLVEFLRIDINNTIFIDFIYNVNAMEFDTEKKYIFFCNSGNKYLIELITSHLKRVVIDCKTDLSGIITKINSLFKGKHKRPFWCDLSNFELYLLPFFCTNFKMQELSDNTGVSLKYLYYMRSRLRQKLGLEQTMQFYHYRNEINLFLKNHTEFNATLIT